METKSLNIFFQHQGTQERRCGISGENLSSPLSLACEQEARVPPERGRLLCSQASSAFWTKPAAGADWCPVAQDRGELCGGTSALVLHPLPSSLLFSQGVGSRTRTPAITIPHFKISLLITLTFFLPLNHF